MTTKGFLFDYGGTLDTGGCHWGKVLWHAYEDVGVPVSEQQFRDAYVHVERHLGRHPVIRPDFTFRQTLEEKVRLQLEFLQTEDVMNKIVDRLYADVLRHTAHSREVLQQLPHPKVLVSNFYGNMATVLREFGFEGLFRQVIESAVVGIRKPDPRIFLLGAETLGLAPDELTVVGDSIGKDIVPARSIGCRTVWLQGEQWTDDPVDASCADCVIQDLQELL